jgi:acetylornithine deacetylase
LHALALLSDLIAIPSVNPMGRELDGPDFFEGRLSDYLCDFFAQVGADYERIEVAPGRANLIARFESDSKITVLMDAHQDTVPVDGMVIAPFEPVIRDGRIYGRGACDVKGGMAAMLVAFARLFEERPTDAANVVMSCSCDEEATVLGVCDLVKLWTEPERAGSLLSRPPDIAVVAEPTELEIVVAHRGATRWKIRTSGRACHSSRPDDGVNAIYRMGKVLTCLEDYAGQLTQLIPPHPLCGPATLSVGRIEGGLSVNTVPDWCTIEMDRRVIPGETGTKVIEPIAEYLITQLDFEVEMLPPWLIGTSLSDNNNHGWADQLMSQIEQVAGSRNKVGVAYGTNAARIAETGVPSIVFGPGHIDQAHTKDEWLSIEQLDQSAEIYYRFISSAGANSA